MKYTSQITIDISQEEVFKELENIENLPHWQKGLLEITPISGEPGEEGSKMKLQYQMGKQKMEIIQTMMKIDFPNEIQITHDTQDTHNIQKNVLKKTENNQTLWIYENEFKFSSLGLQFLGWIMPSVFKKQTMTNMENFKAFAEKGISIKNNDG